MCIYIWVCEGKEAMAASTSASAVELFLSPSFFLSFQEGRKGGIGGKTTSALTKDEGKKRRYIQSLPIRGAGRESLPFLGGVFSRRKLTHKML